MKRILISLSIIGVVGAAVIGFTIAYFNDTETSTGNIFVAGTMDLKVDHKYAMYDGNECTRDCQENLGENLILNGSFENPEVTDPAKWEIFQSGTTGLEWTVEWAPGGSTTYGGRTRPEPALVEYHENVMGAAQDGDQYAELDADWFGPNDPLNGEPALVQIHQDVPTTIGAKYRLHYYYAPRPNTPAGDNILDVEINDANVAHHQMAGGGGSIVWAEYTYEFIATTTSTKVEFVGGGTNNSLGIFLDHVTLHPYNLNCQYHIVGGTCTLWDLKDLGNGDYYWNFFDVKPGDYGTNIISLHAYNNDAYACLIDHYIRDFENTCIDSEVGDTTCTAAPGQGELSGFLKAFVWMDTNQNGVQDSGEATLYGPNVPFTNINTMTRIPLTASHTEYIGIAWCFGTQTVDTNGVIHCSGTGNQDITQTDSFLSSFTVYGEQQRNNSGFSCAVLTANMDKSSPLLFQAH